jgi:ribonuclease HII
MQANAPFSQQVDQFVLLSRRTNPAMTGRILIGTDEAGYGPNLGPLTVAATAWHLPVGVEPQDLWDELKSVLTDTPERGDQRLFVADSKKVFSPGEGLESLEVAVLAFAGLINANKSSIDQLCRGLSMVSQATPFSEAYCAEPWNTMPGLTLPVDSSDDHISEWVVTLNTELKKREIQLLGIRARIMFPHEFNQLVAESDSKGVVLSNATLQLVRDLADSCATDADLSDKPMLIVCDKHGGRNRYDELISQHFDDEFVFRLKESREKSTYRMGRMEFCFRTKAEEFLPVALASMVAKYTREVLMHQFNHFWKQRIPGLKPTQGYPLDAKRFRDDIAAQVESLNIPIDQLWRSR